MYAVMYIHGLVGSCLAAVGAALAGDRRASAAARLAVRLRAAASAAALNDIEKVLTADCRNLPQPASRTGSTLPFVPRAKIRQRAG